jgi:parallel beta-helix repeat protein
MMKLTNASRLLLIAVLLSLALVTLAPVHGQSGLTFDVSRVGTTSTYLAVSRTTPSSYTGTLKFVVESAAASLVSSGGGNILFTAGDFNLGTEYFKLHNTHDVVFAGQGIDVTFLHNATDEAADTEPFNCSNCDRLTIRDMTIAAGGAVRLTSDALDFDSGDDNLIQRIKVIQSRGRAIVFDGKNTGFTAFRNVVRDCIITGSIALDGIQFLASSDNRIENCTISGVARHGIYMSQSSASADQPNKPSDNNVISGNTVQTVSGNGIAVNSSNRNQIIGNTVVSNVMNGIHLTSTASLPCNDNLVNLNTINSNTRYGLYIVSPACNGTVVWSNTFSGNGLGAIRDLGTGTIYSSTPTATPSVSTVIVNAVADAYVNEASPSSNYGNSTTLRTDGSPINRSYLRFQVPSLSGSVVSATLRVFANTASSSGYTVHGTSGGWTETGVTFTNAPTFGVSVGSSGAFSSNSWTSVNVTALVTGSGQYDFVMTSTNTTAVSFSSRTGANLPQLVINVSSGPAFARAMAMPMQMSADTPPNTPTATATLLIMPTPTATSTNMPTDLPTATLTETPTDLPTQAPTVTNTPTNPPTETPTDLPTATSTNTPTDLPTATSTETPTEMPTSTPTETPTEMPTATSTETPTEMPTSTDMPPDALVTTETVTE